MLFLDRERALVYSWMLIAAYIVTLSFLVATANGLVDINGTPIGGDFVLFYAASKVLHELPASNVYDIGLLNSYQSAVIGQDLSGRLLPMFYPPQFLFFIYPLSLLPYGVSLALFLAVSTVLFYLVLRLVKLTHFSLPLLLLAFPGFFASVANGQFSLVTGALLGGGLLLAGKRDVLSGTLIGLAFYKPHLAFPALVALAAGGRKTAVLSCLITLVGLCLASLVVFGPQIWSNFFINANLAQQLIHETSFPVNKMMSTFAALRGVGIPSAFALSIQSIMSTLSLAAICYTWKHYYDVNLRVSITIVCTLIFPHYCFSYDWSIMAIGLSCLFKYINDRNYTPPMLFRIIIGLAYSFPILGLVVSTQTNIQIAPLVLIFLLYIIKQSLNKTRVQ